eukprot:g72088.t1
MATEGKRIPDSTRQDKTRKQHGKENDLSRTCLHAQAPVDLTAFLSQLHCVAYMPLEQRYFFTMGNGFLHRTQAVGPVHIASWYSDVYKSSDKTSGKWVEIPHMPVLCHGPFQVYWDSCHSIYCIVQSRKTLQEVLFVITKKSFSGNKKKFKLLSN